MLLEGLVEKQAPQPDLSRANKRQAKRGATSTKNSTDEQDDGHSEGPLSVSGESYGPDEQDESSSQDLIEVVSPIQAQKVQLANSPSRQSLQRSPQVPKMRSKATSTTSDSASSGAGSLSAPTSQELEAEVDSYEAVPSRTIAVQCDLKSSSAKNSDGFFEPTRSQVLDVASMQASSISSTRYGFYKLSPESMEQRRRLARSISSRNIARSRQALNQEEEAEENEASELSSTGGGREEEEDRDAAFEAARRSPAPVRTGTPADRKRPQRAEDSLPRRPKTALSYVSATRLQNGRRDDSSPEGRPSSCEGSERLARARAMSQQTLSRPRTSAERLDYEPLGPSQWLGSDSEIGADRHRVARNEEILLTRGHQQVPSSERTRLARSNSSLLQPQQAAGSDGRRSDLARWPPGPGQAGGIERLRRRREEEEEEEGDDGESSRRRDVAARQTIGPTPISKPRPRYDDRERDHDEGRFGAGAGGHLSAAETDQQVFVEPPSATAATSRLAARYSSMSLSRRPQAVDRSCPLLASERRLNSKQATGARSHTLRPAANDGDGAISRSDQARGQQTLPARQQLATGVTCRGQRARRTSASSTPSGEPQICRSTSMRQMPSAVGKPMSANRHENERHGKYATGGRGERPYESHERSYDAYSEDSESPKTRTWSNPGRPIHRSPVPSRGHRRQAEPDQPERARPLQATKMNELHPGRDASSNSYELDFEEGMLEVSSPECQRRQAERFEEIYRAHQQCDELRYQSETSEEGSSLGNAQLFAQAAHQQQLDYDSQHRLNESGLPETRDSMAKASHAPSSHLGLTHTSQPSSSAPFGRSPMSRYATTSRSNSITGRAMSQQSLTRPTMPLTSGRRLRRAGSRSGSEVCGSSMSLASRSHGSRYENAHTRTPVVMYIPPATSKPSSMADLSRIGVNGGVSSRKSSRSRLSGKMSMSSSRDRKRSLSRNGSDSESSSMLKTLVKPRRTQQNSNVSRRSSRLERRHGVGADSDESIDGVGQLATEIDSYKFRRRYSVPKDAKINWFAKLRQRVTSSKS